MQQGSGFRPKANTVKVFLSHSPTEYARDKFTDHTWSIWWNFIEPDCVCTVHRARSCHCRQQVQISTMCVMRCGQRPNAQLHRGVLRAPWGNRRSQHPCVPALFFPNHSFLHAVPWVFKLCHNCSLAVCRYPVGVSGNSGQTNPTWSSTIAVFGPESGATLTGVGNECVQRPSMNISNTGTVHKYVCSLCRHSFRCHSCRSNHIRSTRTGWAAFF